jgi:hypothetical protein
LIALSYFYLGAIKIMMKRCINITLTAIIAVSTSFFYSCNSKKTDVNQTAPGLRLISYNVWYGFTEVPERKTIWLSWMNEQGPDIVSLQELNGYTDQGGLSSWLNAGQNIRDLHLRHSFAPIQLGNQKV